MIATFFKILGHPATIIVGVIAGLYFGLHFPERARSLAPFGDVYIELLSMCVLPILVTALTWGIGQMLRDETTRSLFPRMAASYVLLLLIPCGAALIVALGLTPGAQLGDAAATALGQELATQKTVDAAHPFVDLFSRMVPSNVFAALSSTEFLSIVFFSILLGLALGLIESPGADLTLKVLNSFYVAFAKIFGWVLVPLPAGLFCIAATNMANADTELLLALLRYVGYFYLAGLLAIVGLTVFLSITARKPPWRVLAGLKHPLVIGFATDNPLVALYSAMKALRQQFGVDRRVSETVAPFGVIANQHGQVLLFTFTVFFLAQVYEIPLGLTGTMILTIACLVSGATAFGGGAALAPIMAPILLSADIPTSLSVVVLATTQAAVAPLGSLVTVLGTAALAVVTAKPLANRTKGLEAPSDPAGVAGPEPRAAAASSSAADARRSVETGG
ncbi:MAG: cation:dicarboxylase symporter family transporter [Thiohalocapsa sp.]